MSPITYRASCPSARLSEGYRIFGDTPDDLPGPVSAFASLGTKIATFGFGSGGARAVVHSLEVIVPFCFPNMFRRCVRRIEHNFPAT